MHLHILVLIIFIIPHDLYYINICKISKRNNQITSNKLFSFVILQIILIYSLISSANNYFGNKSSLGVINDKTGK